MLNKRMMNTSTLYFFLITLAIFAVISCGGDAGNAETSDVATAENVHPGKKVYNMYCIVCHGSDGSMGANGAHNLQASKLSLEERILVITKGRNTMTAFEKVISEEKIQQVAEYIKTFRK